MSAETTDGGQLRRAATVKKDDSILLQIQGRDCTAIEVKYHKQCYRKYTSFLRRGRGSEDQSESTISSKRLYEESFNIFSEEFVKEKIIKDEGIFYMKKVKNAFVNIVARVEDVDATNYKTSRLKARMQERFPQLVFFTPHSRNKSEIVYCNKMKGSNIVEKVAYDETSQSPLAETREESDEQHGTVETTLKDVYTTALFLKAELERKRNINGTRPPVASDINNDNVRELVSPVLFNFFSWVLGFSGEPEDADYVQLDEEETVKVFSVCQDLLSVYSGGKPSHQDENELKADF